MIAFIMESYAEENVLNNLLKCCRVCEKPDKYANLFYNINKELLKNLSSLIQIEIKESDGLSKWLCRECTEKVEDFTKFIESFLETSNKILLLRQGSSSLSPRMKEKFEIDQETYEVLSLQPTKLKEELEIEIEQETSEIEALDESFEQLLSPVEDKNESLAVSQYDDRNEVLNRTEASSTEKAISVFDCDICFKRYLSRNSLNRHVRITHEMMRVPCSFCGLKFTQKASLDEHTKNLHKESTSSEAFICTFDDTCARTFNTAKMLNQHLKCHNAERDRKPITAVTVKKKYRKQCSTCGLFFKHIEEHKLTHQAENTFHCHHPECNKKFKFNTSLQVHLRIHNNERKFECNICNKKFRVSHHLKEHLNIHSTDKAFACDICPKRFASKLNLYKHSKLHLKERNK